MNKKIIVTIFIFFTALPVMDMIFNVDPFPSISENRNLADFPKYSTGKIENFPEKYENFFNDHFGFRQTLIQLRSFLWFNVFNLAPTDKVFLGEDNWFFNTGEILYKKDTMLYNSKQLIFITNKLNTFSQKLNECGIDFHCIIIPNKSTIYSDYLFKNRNSSKTRLDQLSNHLIENTKIKIVDLRKRLIEAKKENRIYYQFDSHWNELGGFIGVKEIINQINIELFTPENFNIEYEKWSPDLLKVGGLENFYYEDRLIINCVDCLRPESIRRDSIISILKSKGKLDLSEVPYSFYSGNDSLPKAVIFHDSFFGPKNIKEFIAHNFSYAQFYHVNYYEKYESVLDIIRREKPDIVLYEFVERKLFIWNRGLRVFRDLYNEESQKIDLCKNDII